jgi:hypothetical protein
MDGPGTSRAGIQLAPALSTALLIAVALLLLAGAPARADEAPVIIAGPTIAGTLQEGATLVATATYTGTPAPTDAWTWLRCTRRGASSCTPIAGATSSTHTLTAADAGLRIRVQLIVSNGAGEDGALSGSTDIVQAVPPPDPTGTPSPTATPIPTATPVPAGTPTPTPTTSLATALPSFSLIGPPPPSGSSPVTRPRLRMLRPFPVVRVRGRFTAYGAVVTLLTIRAPRGVRIAIRCSGRGCPARRWAKASVLMRARRFERTLRSGVRLVVTVTRPGGWIGKRTSVLIRRGRPPARVDRCLYPGSNRPRRCPA